MFSDASATAAGPLVPGLAAKFVMPLETKAGVAVTEPLTFNMPDGLTVTADAPREPLSVSVPPVSVSVPGPLIGPENVPPLVTVRAVGLRFRLPGPFKVAMVWEELFR